MSEAVKIVEVGPRDGLQNDSLVLSVDQRAELIQKLIAAGLRSLEGGSFVSPKAIPPMADSEKVFERLKDQALVSSGEVELSFLVPNQKGLERALQAGVRAIAIFSATSDSFTQKNIQRSVKDSLEEFKGITKHALALGIRVRGYVSTAFGCPYEGRQKPERVVEITQSLFDMGCGEVSIGDTIGVAHPRQIRDVFGRLIKEFSASRIAAHLHDTRGMALVNAKEALDLGIRTFDGSVGGLGGCPYAPGASGNVATEELVWLMEGLGFKTGVDLQKLLDAATFVQSLLGRTLRSKFYQSNPKPYYFDGA
jgi:hydroxymethylglutaryl-CoA lyase